MLYGDGPSTPPSLHLYDVEGRIIEELGSINTTLRAKAMPSASAVSWKARDGLELSGYLTRLPGAKDAQGLPLIVMSHGGPELRDTLTFGIWVQYFAANGLAVFQPNFRGSDGFDQACAMRGCREWDGEMQDDVTDGVQRLISQGAADPQRMCIVGASNGGYAALAGASMTLDLYRCAASIAGVTDLYEFAKWRKTKWGADSEVYLCSLESLGDPGVDRRALEEKSPTRLVDAIKIPVLLIHGQDDEIVPVAQSERMHKVLTTARKPAEFIRVPREGHS